MYIPFKFWPVFFAVLLTLAFQGGCARKTLEIRLPQANPEAREIGETINAAASILRQLENNPDDIAITYGSGTPASAGAEQAF